MTTLSAEKIFYNYIRPRNEYFKFVKPDFFRNIGIQECFRIDVEFYEKYQSTPSKQQTIELLTQKKSPFFLIKEDDEEFIDIGKVDSIFEDVSEYDNDWMSDNVQAWIKAQNMKKGIFDAAQIYQLTEITAENVQDVADKVNETITNGLNVNFKFDHGLNFFDPESHILNPADTFTTGYSWLDEILGGGWQTKTLNVFAGPVKGGKCVCGDTKIKIRNKTTNLIEDISIEDFYKRFQKI